MNKMKIRKSDTVMVISGKDKGKSGKVLRVFPEKNSVIVEKLKFTKEFIRRDHSKNISGGIMEKEAPIHISNVLLFCTECDQGVRIKSKRLDDGTWIRVCTKCDITIEKQ